MALKNCKITLEAARMNCNLSVGDVSRLIEIPLDVLEFYEKFPSEIPFDIAIKLSKLYKMSLDHIDFGV